MTSLNLLNDALDQFDAAVAGAYPQIVTAALDLWTAMAVLQVGMVCYRMMRTWDMREMLNEFVFAGIVAVVFVRVLIEHALEWGGDVIGTGEQIAAFAGGSSITGITPTDVFDQGIHIVEILWDRIGLGAFLFHPSDTLALYIASGIVGFSFFIAGAIYFYALLEATFTVGWGAIVICFATLEWTSPSLLRWCARIVSLAIKLCVILLLVGAGTSLVDDWTTSLQAGLAGGRGTIWNYWALMVTVVSLLWCSLMITLPWVLSHLIATAMFMSGERHAQLAGSIAGGMAASAAKAGAGEVASTAGAMAERVQQMIRQP